MEGPGQGAEAIGMIAGFLCAFVVVVTLGLLIGAVIFRAACSIYNRMCQPENRVPEPSFGKAALIVLVAGIAQNVVGFGIGLVVGTVAAAGFNTDVAQIASALISLPFGLVICGAINTWLLPTTFGRGLLVAVAQLAISIAIGLVIGVIVIAVMLAVGGFRGLGF